MIASHHDSQSLCSFAIVPGRSWSRGIIRVRSLSKTPTSDHIAARHADDLYSRHEMQFGLRYHHFFRGPGRMVSGMQNSLCVSPEFGIFRSNFVCVSSYSSILFFQSALLFLTLPSHAPWVFLRQCVCCQPGQRSVCFRVPVFGFVCQLSPP